MAEDCDPRTQWMLGMRACQRAKLKFQPPRSPDAHELGWSWDIEGEVGLETSVVRLRDDPPQRRDLLAAGPTLVSHPINSLAR